jgi:hypothetical protein
MKCPRCKARGKDWDGDDSKCAFQSTHFDRNNWNCATMNALREIAEDRSEWSEDQHAALIPIDGRFIVLGWYKHRGCTEYAGVLDGTQMHVLKLEDAEEALVNVPVKSVEGE